MGFSIYLAPVAAGKIIKICRVDCCIGIGRKGVAVTADKPSWLLIYSERQDIDQDKGNPCRRGDQYSFQL